MDATKEYYMIQGLLFLTVDLGKVSPPHTSHILVQFYQENPQKDSASRQLMPVVQFVEIYYRFGLAEREGRGPQHLYAVFCGFHGAQDKLFSQKGIVGSDRLEGGTCSPFGLINQLPLSGKKLGMEAI